MTRRTATKAKPKAKITKGFCLLPSHERIIRSESEASKLSLGDTLSLMVKRYASSMTSPFVAPKAEVVSFRIKPETADKIEEISLMTGKTSSAVVRDAIDHFFKQKDASRAGQL